jgi:hypothetical protein
MLNKKYLGLAQHPDTMPQGSGLALDTKAADISTVPYEIEAPPPSEFIAKIRLDPPPFQGILA